MQTLIAALAIAAFVAMGGIWLQPELKKLEQLWLDG
jgi:hypothetical protein